MDNILFVGEYTRLELENTPLAVAESYYVMGGYRFDNVLVHVTYGGDDDMADDLTTQVPFGLAPAIDFLKASTQGLTNSQKEETNYVTLVLRWDFHDSAALKFEYTDFTDDLNSNQDAGLFRVALTTVF
jgi:hypothetical protein